MKIKLINTGTYLLLIDEEAEIKEGDYYTHKGKYILKSKGEIKIGLSKIIAYHPLTKEPKELDLPLLPPFDSVYIEKLAQNEWSKLTVDMNFSVYNKSLWVGGFQHGYIAAQSKQFSLEDMEEAYYQGRNDSTDNEHNFKSLIQSLSTQQLPVDFIPEYEYLKCSECDGAGWMISCKKCNGKGSEKLSILKIIKNSEDKEIIVGTYKY